MEWKVSKIWVRSFVIFFGNLFFRSFLSLSGSNLSVLCGFFFFVVKVFQISFGTESISFVCIIFVQEKWNLTGVKALGLEKAWTTLFESLKKLSIYAWLAKREDKTAGLCDSFFFFFCILMAGTKSRCINRQKQD